MIPFPPLDGYSVLRSLWPNSPIIPFVNQYSMPLLIVFFLFAGHILTPVVSMAILLLQQVGLPPL